MPTLASEWIEEGKQIGLMEGREEGREEGIYEGIERGIERGKLELIKNMINQGLKVEDISKFTGLSMEKIEEIIKSVES